MAVSNLHRLQNGLFLSLQRYSKFFYVLFNSLFAHLRACTFAPQTLETIERLSAEPIQEKQGLRENHSTSARVKDEVP